MQRNNIVTYLRTLSWLAAALLALATQAIAAQTTNRPNIVVIISDDQGYGDISFNPHHPKEVSTPHMDALAKEGIFFHQAYISGHVCSPTRAGLMTGRYQQRVGIYTAGEGGSGMPLNQKLFPQYLKEAGYICGAFGKWHLGLTEPYNPINRGFDEFYGFMGRGGHDYFKLDDPEMPLYRGLKTISDKGYLTDRLTDEAVDFIHRHKEKPFFVYLAYNAVHTPTQAPEATIKLFNTGDKTRDIYLAQLKHLDEGIGRVIASLKQEGVFDNTLLFFLTDNGGPKQTSINAPLRGYKHMDLEGGIRTPFVISWPAQFKGGRTIDNPIISLDILPTAIAAAGAPCPTNFFDGKNLLPLIRGEISSVHSNLFWASSEMDGWWAIRSGNLKLVAERAKVELFDLSKDPGENENLAGKMPAKVTQLTKMHEAWLSEMAPPIHGGTKKWIPNTPNSAKTKKQLKQERQGQKKASAQTRE